MECLQYLVSQEERSALPSYTWFLEDVTRVRLRKEYVFWLSEEIGAIVKRHPDVADSAIWYADVCFPRFDASCRRRGVLACMYLALKVHHEELVSLDELLVEDEKPELIMMEAKVLEILEWRLHPPVVSVFISQLGHLLSVKRDAIEAAHEHWRLVCARTKLLHFKSSVKACALLRHFDGKIEASTLAQMCSCSADEIAACGRVLWRKRRLDGSDAGVECSL